VCNDEVVKQRPLSYDDLSVCRHCMFVCGRRKSQFLRKLRSQSASLCRTMKVQGTQYFDVNPNSRWRTAANMKMVISVCLCEKPYDHDDTWYTESDSGYDGENNSTKIQNCKFKLTDKRHIGKYHFDNNSAVNCPTSAKFYRITQYPTTVTFGVNNFIFRMQHILSE